jgi:hypothetical protein
MNAQALRGLRPDTVNEHVRGFRETHQRFECARPLQVEHDAALVAIRVHEEGRHARFFVCPEWRMGSPSGASILITSCAHVAQDLGGERPQHIDRQVDNAYAGSMARSAAA